MAKTTTRTVLNLTNATLRLLINIIIFSVLIILVYKYAWEAYRFAFRVFGEDPVDNIEETAGSEITIKVDKGDSALTVGAKLELARAIHDKFSFYIRARLVKAKFHPGLYTVSTTMSYDDMFEVFAGEGNAEEED